MSVSKSSPKVVESIEYTPVINNSTFPHDSSATPIEPESTYKFVVVDYVAQALQMNQKMDPNHVTDQTDDSSTNSES